MMVILVGQTVTHSLFYFQRNQEINLPAFPLSLFFALLTTLGQHDRLFVWFSRLSGQFEEKSQQLANLAFKLCPSNSTGIILFIIHVS
jgi:hypothetical protein